MIALLRYFALFLVYAWAACPADAIAHQNNGEDAALIKKGEYLARAGDCVACHTAQGGASFAGGLPIQTPIGTVYSSNITPDKANGIGKYTLDEFDRAVRQGVRKDGASLYPAMPFPSYAKVTLSDIKALYAYFMYGVQPAQTPNRAVDIPWPLSVRWPLALWRKAFRPTISASDSIATSDPVTRGRYLVEGLGHCGACHTPRGVGLQERALTDDGKVFLSGGVVDSYFAGDLRQDTPEGLARWSEQDIVLFLRSGSNSHSAAFGGMADVVSNSTQYLSDDDLAAIAKYLRTLQPATPSEIIWAYDNTAATALHAGTDHSYGAIMFINNCAACHRTNALGYTQTFPKLALSPVVNANDPVSLIHIVLTGAETPGTGLAPLRYAMPGFAQRLSDRDIADVLSFVRASWGNHASAVTASQVANVRKQIEHEIATADSSNKPGH